MSTTEPLSTGRESGYIVGDFYEDADRKIWQRRPDTGYPWMSFYGTPAAGNTPALPLRKLVPAGSQAVEIARLQNAYQSLNRIVNGLYRAMEAARIELVQAGDARKAMAWIIASLEDVSDAPEVEWNGTETAQEWWDRTEAAYRVDDSAGATA